MSTHVLARQWRPRRFGEVIGQDHVVRALQYSVLHEAFHQAYLLTGTRGVGKTTLARILAKSANCLSENQSLSEAEPCGTCTNCLAIEKGSFADLLEIDAATNTSVDAMRSLLETVAYPPYMGKKKIYVIDEVHMLSTAAFNAMLKSLEEPPPYLIFVLATTDPQKVPITILSRCLQFNLKSLPESLLIEHFSTILTQEKIDFDTTAIPLIARSANGSVRDGLSLMDQLIAQGAGGIRESAVQEILGVVSYQWTGDILTKMADRQANALATMASELSACSISFDDALAQLGKTVLALQMIQLGADCPEGIDKNAIAPLVERFSAETLQLIYQIALTGRRDLPYAPDAYSGFLMTLLRMMAFTPAVAPSELPPTPPRPTEKKKSDITPVTLKEDIPNNPPSSLNNTIAQTHFAEKNNKADNEAIDPQEPPPESFQKDNKVGDGAEYSDPKSSFPPIIDSPPKVENQRWSFLLEKNWPEQVEAMALSPPLWRISHHSAPLACQEINIGGDTAILITMILEAREKHLLNESLSSTKTFFNILQAHFAAQTDGKPIHLQWYLGPLPENTVAYHKQYLEKARQQAADQIIKEHPVVQVLQKKYRAKILSANAVPPLLSNA